MNWFYTRFHNLAPALTYHDDDWKHFRAKQQNID